MFEEVLNKHLRRYQKYIDVYLKDGVGREKFYLPSSEVLCNKVSQSQGEDDLQGDLIRAYDKMYGEKGEGVDRAVKINQMLAKDGLVWGYNIERDEMVGYTANEGIVGGEGRYNDANTVQFNKEGVINALKLNAEYKDLQGLCNMKFVRPVGKYKLVVKDHIIVPDLVISRLIVMLDVLMRAGRVVEIVHNSDEAIHTRYVSLNESVLMEYNGGEKPLHEMRIVDFRYTGRVYLPVVGAPLSSAGLTRIDFKDLDRIKVLDRRQAYKIKEADNRISSLIQSEVFSTFVEQVFAEENEEHRVSLCKVLNGLHEQESGVKDSLPYNSNRWEYIRSIRDLTPENQNALFNSLGEGAKGIAERLGGILTMVEKVDVPKTFNELRAKLYEGVYRIVLMRQSGSFYSLYATNNRDILKRAYGDDYVARFENDFMKVRALREEWDNSKSAAENIMDYGLTHKIEGVDESEYVNVMKDFYQKIMMYEDSGQDSNEDTSGAVRVLFNPESSRSFYRNVALSKVYSLTRMG